MEVTLITMLLKPLQYYFPYYKNGGIYAIEDTQTSYWPDYGGDSENLNNPDTIMNYFKKLTDNLNYKELKIPGYQPSYLEENIISMHFYHNMIFIYKGKNKEESNFVKNGKT